eukprot:jgi/Mesvir1/18623/Mv17132-RA.1
MLAVSKMSSVKTIDQLDVNNSITFSDNDTLTSVNPFMLGRFAKFVSTTNIYGRDVLEFQVFNPTSGVFEMFFQVGGEQVYEPPEGDYRLAYLQIARELRDPPAIQWSFADITELKSSRVRAGTTSDCVQLTTDQQDAIVDGMDAVIDAILATGDPSNVVLYDENAPVYPSWKFVSSQYNRRRLWLQYYTKLSVCYEMVIAMPDLTTAIAANEYRAKLKFWNPTAGNAPNYITIHLRHDTRIVFSRFEFGSSYPPAATRTVTVDSSTSGETVVTIAHPTAFDPTTAYGIVDIGGVVWTRTGAAFTTPSGPLYLTSAVDSVNNSVMAPYTMDSRVLITVDDSVDLPSLLSLYPKCSMYVTNIPIDYVYK